MVDRAWQRVQWRDLQSAVNNVGDHGTGEEIVERLHGPVGRDAILVARRVAQQTPAQTGRPAHQRDHWSHDASHRYVSLESFGCLRLQTVAGSPKPPG
jgi:hypothetical protein